LQGGGVLDSLHGCESHALKEENAEGFGLGNALEGEGHGVGVESNFFEVLQLEDGGGRGSYQVVPS